MKDKVSILLVCGYGVGSSLLLKMTAEKQMVKYGINAEMKHTSAGEASGFSDWADIIAVNSKLADIVNEREFPGKHIIKIMNIMNGDEVGSAINNVVQEYYKDAIKR